MTQFNFSTMMSQENQIKQIPVDMLIPYHNHEFTLYQGERLDDMIESISSSQSSSSQTTHRAISSPSSSKKSTQS